VDKFLKKNLIVYDMISS